MCFRKYEKMSALNNAMIKLLDQTKPLSLLYSLLQLILESFLGLISWEIQQIETCVCYGQEAFIRCGLYDNLTDKIIKKLL